MPIKRLSATRLNSVKRSLAEFIRNNQFKSGFINTVSDGDGFAANIHAIVWDDCFDNYVRKAVVAVRVMDDDTIEILTRHYTEDYQLSDKEIAERNDREWVAIDGPDVLLTDALEQLSNGIEKYVETPIEEFSVIRKEDRVGITDSLLMESGIEIASATIGKNKYSIRVCGEVRILWKDEVYKYLDDFPDDLVEAIRNHTLDSNPDAEIGNNNWYEIFAYKKNGDWLYSDVIDIDLADMSDDDFRSLFADTHQLTVEEFD